MLVTRARELVDEFPALFRLLPGLSVAEVDALAGRIGLPLPDDVRELLAVTRGIAMGPDDVHVERFDDPDDRSAYHRTVVGWPARPWVLSSDGGRGSFLVSIHPGTGAWGPVFHSSNLTSYAVQAPSLGAYLEQLGAAARSVNVQEELDGLGLELPEGTDPWTDKEFRSVALDVIGDFRNVDTVPARVLTSAAARDSADGPTAELAAGLDDMWLVVDLGGDAPARFTLRLSERDEAVPTRCPGDGTVFAMRMRHPGKVAEVAARHR